MGVNIKDLDSLTGVATNDQVPIIDKSDTSDSAEGSLKLTTVSEFTAALGGGDMTKAVYDADNDGVVDNSEALGGQNSAYHLSRSNHTGSQAIGTVTGLQTALDGKSATGHSHNDLYYTETEVNNLLAGYSASGHDHDTRYYTEGEVDALLTGKSATGHTHTESDISDLGAYLTDITGESLNDLSDVNVSGAASGSVLKYNGTNWYAGTDISGSGGSGGVTDHGALTGLSDDDHTQYHNDTRADTWLATKTLDNITAGTTNKHFTATDESKLDGIETGADVTDTTNVTNAGALMDSEVDVDIKTLSLPANTTISAFGATLVDDADAATARTTLDVDQAGTDNSTDVTLSGTPDYITISGQVITRNQIDLTTDVTGVLPEANLPNASASAEGVVELATTAETTTGTDTGRVVTPDGLAGSIFGQRALQATVVDYTTDIATGDGKFYFVVPQSLNGMNLTRVHARVISAGTTGTTDIQLHNVTDAQDMLSTKLTIDSGETGSDTAATAAVINATYDDVATNDLIRVDIDAVSTTAPKGLILTLEFLLP